MLGMKIKGLRDALIGGAQWLTSQHVRAVQLTVNHAVKQYFPVCLCFQSYVQTFVFEVTFFISNGQRSHVSQFDETKLQLFLFCVFFCAYCMLAGQPLGATIGFGTQAHIITAFSMDLNGNGITVSNDIWEQMKEHIPMDGGKPVHPIKADYLKPVVDKYKSEGKPFNMGMVFPVSTHNYELRYWLAAGGINPGYYAPHKGDTSGQLQADALLSVTPPPQMPATLEAGTIYGYCVGEPWNQQAVFKGILIQPVSCTDHRLQNLLVSDRVFFSPGFAHTEYFFWVVFPDLVVSDDWNTNTFEYSLLVPWFAYAVAVNGAGFQSGWHLQRDLPVLLRRYLVPDSDAPLGPDRRREV